MPCCNTTSLKPAKDVTNFSCDCFSLLHPTERTSFLKPLVPLQLKHPSTLRVPLSGTTDRPSLMQCGLYPHCLIGFELAPLPPLCKQIMLDVCSAKKAMEVWYITRKCELITKFHNEMKNKVQVLNSWGKVTILYQQLLLVQ